MGIVRNDTLRRVEPSRQASRAGARLPERMHSTAQIQRLPRFKSLLRQEGLPCVGTVWVVDWVHLAQKGGASMWIDSKHVTDRLNAPSAA